MYIKCSVRILTSIVSEHYGRYKGGEGLPQKKKLSKTESFSRKYTQLSPKNCHLGKDLD